MRNYFLSGSWNAICDVCGQKKKFTELRKRWDGLIVCEPDWEMDHPQKYLRVRETGESVPVIRDEPTDTFVSVTYAVPAECDLVGRRGIAGYGRAGCMIAGSGF